MSFRTYGSGYPGVVGRGTAGRGFPFFFWPIVWPVAAGAGAAAYLSGSDEVGALTYSSCLTINIHHTVRKTR
jgi:hypothetical protein